MIARPSRDSSLKSHFPHITISSEVRASRLRKHSGAHISSNMMRWRIGEFSTQLFASAVGMALHQRQVTFEKAGKSNHKVTSLLARNEQLTSDSNSVRITQLIKKAQHGSRDAEEKLVILLRDRLRALAKTVLREREDSIQATELVHLAWIKVFHGTADPDLPNRKAFLAYMAKAMRTTLIDHLRHRARSVDGVRDRQPVELLDGLVAEYESRDQISLLDLNDALQELRHQSERQFQTVELRYFGGMTMSEIADFHGVSLSMVEKEWRLARAKLRMHLESKDSRG